MPVEYPELVIKYDGTLLAGVDEVGRGPLIGAVVAAAVILDPARPVDGLGDSKMLTSARREHLAEEIRDKALAFAVAEASALEIDELNIYHATHLAMRRAIDALKPSAEYLLVDGNRLPGHHVPGQAVVKGDARHPAIGAASILAKVARDAQMLTLHERFPDYGFARHKGYPTPEHLAALERLGPLSEHRRTFAPVKRQLELF
ncbi:ribonuclease HII [Litchfieldella anticariensis FP35 = DSM 16096]|uniref:Ribonuclease HII n=1 Tax=Litchfieldella anticariensis (strain DSM 16096 / CECT 5854 / CIP 108499 / LMG 22089 / FP35) TaxID=1121939 RepID=S2L245_LITA3|nr:ribonuclease HII [Halomonas anticariensis]EPC01739.1 ribonuclease HII [Halomonas anticariensis FP35 = DSM 16096]